MKPVFNCTYAALSLLTLTACTAPSGLTTASRDGVATSAAPQSAAASPPAESLGLPEPMLDGGPATPTALTSTSYSIDGLIMPVMRGQQLIQTRADMRRTDGVFAFDNRLLRNFVSETRSADIVRLDKKLVWTLYPAKKTFKECPLTGCRQPNQTTPDKPRQEPQAKATEPSCPLTLRKNELKVDANGEHKTINNFNTEHIQLGWTVELEDKQGRITANRVVLDLWTTPETGSIKQVQMINEAFQKRWTSALSVGEHPFGKFLPRDVMGAMSGLMHNINMKDAKAVAAWGKELRKVHGYPIATTLSWSVSGSACGDDSNKTSTSPSAIPPTSVSGLLGNLVGGMVQDKVKDSASNGTLLTYNYEVKTIAVKPVSDSAFKPDPGYQQISN